MSGYIAFTILIAIASFFMMIFYHKKMQLLQRYKKIQFVICVCCPKSSFLSKNVFNNLSLEMNGNINELQIDKIKANIKKKIGNRKVCTNASIILAKKNESKLLKNQL